MPIKHQFFLSFIKMLPTYDSGCAVNQTLLYSKVVPFPIYSEARQLNTPRSLYYLGNTFFYKNLLNFLDQNADPQHRKVRGFDVHY